MQNFSIFSLCMDRKLEKRNSESNVNISGKRFNGNEFFRSFSRTNLCITQQDLYKYSRQCQDYFRSSCMCCKGKVTPEKVIQSKELNGTPIIPINLSPDVHIKTEESVLKREQQISTVSSPSIDRTNSTVLLASTDDPDENFICEYASAGDLSSNKTQNEGRFSAHSKSSSKKSLDEIEGRFSAHSKSSSKKSLDEIEGHFSANSKSPSKKSLNEIESHFSANSKSPSKKSFGENVSHYSAYPNSPSKESLDESFLDPSSPVTIVAADENTDKARSRPISVSSIATTKSLYEDYELRPCGSAAKSNVSSASMTSRNNNKSRASTSADENNRPISNISRATLNFPNEDDVENHNDRNSGEERHNDNVAENVAQEVYDVEHLPNDGFMKPVETESVPITESRENNEIIHIQAEIISSDNESNCTTDAVDEVDFIKEPSDEHTTTTSTVSSVQNFNIRPSIRFRKRKVSPTKPAVQITSRQKTKDQHVACLQQLDSSNWDQIMLGLQRFVGLMRNNPEQIEPQLHQYCLALSKNIKNLRSQVSRASCQAAGEFFESHSKLLEQEADDLALALLNRSADTNKFLRSDATKALKIMCETLPIPKVIQIVTTKGATHQNAVVRTASANLCNQIIERCGVDKIFAMNRDLRDKLILTGANLLMEGSLDTRNYAKMFFKQLSYHPSYHKTLLDVIPPRTYRNIEKTLKNIK